MNDKDMWGQLSNIDVSEREVLTIDVGKLQASDLEISHLVKCYYGAFDSRTHRVHVNRAAVLLAIRNHRNGAWTTYFPMGGFWTLSWWEGRRYKSDPREFNTKGQALWTVLQDIYQEENSDGIQ